MYSYPTNTGFPLLLIPFFFNLNDRLVIILQMMKMNKTTRMKLAFLRVILEACMPAIWQMLVTVKQYMKI